MFGWFSVTSSAVPTPTQVSAAAAHTHLCLSLLLCGAQIIEASSWICVERDHSFRSFSRLLPLSTNSNPTSCVGTCWDRSGRWSPLLLGV